MDDGQVPDVQRFKGAAQRRPGTLQRRRPLLELKYDVLVPAAIHSVITEENANQIKARLILEATKHPITPEADRILSAGGVNILRDILVNVGGVVMPYFERPQNL